MTDTDNDPPTTSVAPPAAEAPSTEATTTEASSTEASSTEASSIGASSTGASSTEASSTEATTTAATTSTPAADLAPGVPFVVGEWVYGAIEALCFVSGEAVSAGRVREVLTDELPAMEGCAGMAPPSLLQVKEVFAELLRRWSDPTRSTGQGFRLVEVDGGLVFRTQSNQARFVRRMQLGRPQKLSRAALETLAVIAYRQPVTKPQIEEIRGVDCGGALKALLDKKLVRILGKAEDVGRPLLYGTSKTFLDFFNLQSLTDLPTLKQLQEIEGTAPAAVVDTGGPAVVMDLFHAGDDGLVSAETEEESADALDALEKALGEAKKAAKTASSLVFGIEVPDEEGKSSSET